MLIVSLLHYRGKETLKNPHLALPYKEDPQPRLLTHLPFLRGVTREEGIPALFPLPSLPVFRNEKGFSFLHCWSLLCIPHFFF